MEQAADEGFDCVSCQPYVVKPAGEYQVLGRGERGQARGALLWDRASSCLGLPVSSIAPVAPPELVPMKVKEPGESQKSQMPGPEET